MKIFTIGFTKTSAEHFFKRLKQAGVKRVLDVRLNNVSQLAGFAKKEDLKYFLNALCGIEYEHMPELAPSQEMLDDYKKHKGKWEDYEIRFLNLIQARRIEQTISQANLENACLLCSEDKPHYCHRRLVVDYLKDKWDNLEVTHL